MNKTKQKMLELAGWKVGDAADFLELNEEEIKQLDIRFKLWLEASKEVQMIPIQSLIMTKEEIEAAVSNISRGYGSATPGPVEIVWRPRLNQYQLVNGYHRVVEAIMRKEEEIQAIPEDEDTSNWILPSKKDLFYYQPDMKYGGMEEFIEFYMLKYL